MALRLRTTLMRTLVVLGCLVLVVEMLVVQRIQSLRDLQRDLIEVQQQIRLAERQLNPAIIFSSNEEGATIQAQLARFGDLLSDCCRPTVAALSSAAAVQDRAAYQLAYQDLRTAFDSRVDDHLAEIDTVMTVNAWLPWGFFALLAIVLTVAWRVLQRNFLGPIVRLHGAVRRADRTGSFDFTNRAVDYREIGDLAVSFDNLLTRLSSELAGRELALREARDMARRESERVSAELTELIDGSPSPIFSLDLEGRITHWNRKMGTVSGLDERAAKGQFFVKQCLQGTDQPVFERHFLSVVEGGEIQEFQLTVTSATGSHARLLASLTPRRSYGGDIVGVTCFGQPVSGFLLETARSVEQQRVTQFSELASSAAHQLNQPLQKMRLYLANAQNRLRVEPLDRAVLVEKLGGVDEQLSAVSEIIEHLREFGRPVKPLPGGFQLGTVIDRCVQLSRGGLVERGIRVIFDNDLGDQIITGHPLQIEKPLIALINNARDAVIDGGPLQGEVKVSAALGADGGARIVVSDNGNGLSPDLHRRIFEPFFTTRDGSGNVGLGLSVAQAMIEGLNGSLEVTFHSGHTEAVIKLPPMSEPKDPDPVVAE